MRLSKTQRLFKDALDAAATDLGLVGKFEKSQPHDKYLVVLPSGEVLKLSVFKTPSSNDGYAKTLNKRLRSMIHRFCEERGVT